MADQQPTILSHYLLERALGAGGMGTVYSAVDQRDGSPVAVKLLHPHLARDAAFRQQFEREAHVAALLRSPYTVHLIDYGATPDGQCFLVMEYVDGEPVSALLERGPLSVDRALQVAGQAARALEEAHARGVVHRDIKPENLLVRGDGTVKVSDFGIARRAGAGTVTGGAFYGTLAYAAPEQLEGQADERSDLWALGATLFHMAAGRPPFPGPLAQLPAQIRAAEVDTSALAPAVASIVERCLVADPQGRYASASALALDLERAARATASGDLGQTYVAPLKPVASPIMLKLAPLGGSRLARRVRASRYRLTVDNRGEQHAFLELRGEDRGGRCNVHVPKRISVDAGTQATTIVKVSPVRRRWRGTPLTSIFTVYASSGGSGPPASASARFDDVPFGWVPYAAGATAALAAAAIAGGAVALSADAEAEQEPLRIGLLAPFSGRADSGADGGSDYLNAARLAVAEINADGGVNGRPVVIVSADSAGDPEIAVQEARRLVNDEDVDAIIEAGGFVATEVAQQVTDPAKVVLVASVPGEPPQGGAGQLELTPEASATSPPDDAPAAAKGPGFLFKTLVSPIAEQYAAGALIAQAGLTTACFVYSPEFIIDESGVEPRTEKREYDALRAAAPGVSWTEVEHQQPDTNVAQSPAAAATGAPTLDEAIALADEQARLELEQCGASEAVVLEVDWEEYPNAAGVSPPSIVRSSALQAAVTSDFQLVLTTSTLLGSIVYLDGTSVSILDNLDLTNVTNFHVLAAGAFDAARGKQFDDTFFGRFGDETAATTSSGLPDLPLAQLRSVYDAVYLIALAAEQADSRGGEALRDALLSVANSPGVDPVSDEPNLAAGRFRQGAELIARGQEIDFEGAAGPVQFDVNGNNVQGAVYVLSANVQGELIATDALIVDVTSGTVSAPRGRVITSDSFAIGVSFDAPAGFSVATDRTNDFAIERRRADAGRDAYIVFTRPQTVQGATEGELVPAPADFIAWLVAHPKIQLLSEVIDVTIGGRPARQVDITSDVGTHLFTIDEMSRFILVPSEIARVLAIDVDGQQMLILTGAILPFDVPESSGAAVEMAAFEELLPELEEMIASVRFE